MIEKTPKDQPLKSVLIPTLHIPCNKPQYSFFLNHNAPCDNYQLIKFEKIFSIFPSSTLSSPFLKCILHKSAELYYELKGIKRNKIQAQVTKKPKYQIE